MIHVDRRRNDDTGRPIRPSNEWFQRASAATTAAADAVQSGAEPPAVTGLYKDDQVKIALEKLFEGKCAYCESILGTTADWDVEHFRPKGRVAERSDHRGYYWLAYTWENLYPSCSHCNQRRRDPGTWDDPAAGPALGKVDQFPVADETTRAMTHTDSLDRETALLIDPCAEDPANYLRYLPDGQIEPVDDPAVRPRGETSIRVFHLNRRRLRAARRHHLAIYVKFLEAIAGAEARGDASVVSVTRDLLTEWLARTPDYLGAVRFVDAHRAAFGLT